MPRLLSVSRERLVSVWRRATALAAPVVVEQILRTFMRTTDVIVAGVLSPPAAAGVGIGDSFARILSRVGSGLGGATIAISSQDTGVEAFVNRDEAITQAILIGFLVGFPFVLFGALFSHFAIAILGAEREVVRLGGQYLAIIMMGAPIIHVSKISSKALQGTGDTRTPMFIRGFANVLNTTVTITLAFGLGPFPRMSVVGIGLATVLGESVSVLLFLSVIYRPASDIQFVRPAQLTITKQLVRISIPRIGEGLTGIVTDLPFNAVLLAIGTEANAAYHIGRRVYQQVLAPVNRGLSTAANIIVGQTLGEDAERAYVDGGLVIALSTLLAVVLSVVLFVWGAPLIGLFTEDPTTTTLSMGFIQAFAVAGTFYVARGGFRGALRGGSDTRTPFVATVVGLAVFLLGISYVGGLVLGYGVVAVYVAIVVDFTWRAGFLGYIYYRGNWLAYGAGLMEDRGSVEEAPASGDN